MKKTNKTLIVIDMQKDFIDGALGSKEAVAIVDNVAAKIEDYRKNNNPIIFTRDTHYDNYMETHEGKCLPVPHCIKDTDGWQILNKLKNAAGDTMLAIDKPTFGFNGWEEYITENDEIEIIGVCTDICVVSNALILRALFPEIEITVDSSCCAGVTPESHKAALTTMKMCQINVI